ncbi:DUF4232 domain-containing protein [Actinacidiphila sp. DG2A-62]|uniref:DUF4232 domain-containing protein n=1 Tax=Actinacidiphila sp. DG2A-62 TaxID=3108821 RepID=UPI002DBAD034|nr:DUF4232 domain-containing protein [Actinacidiphila sp. DG2A-62]MEC3995411.1 DUF4232 domain-containing protein [Actinacidiphila sp. DG2A-62]
MQLIRTAAAATTLLAGALALTACGNDATASHAGPPADPAAVTAAATTAPGDAPSAPDAGPDTSGTGTDASGTSANASAPGANTAGGDTSRANAPRPAAGQGAKPAAASGRCHTGDLAFSWGSPSPDGDASRQQQAYVVLRNTSGHTCTMRGFPGVDLVNSGTQWSLRRTSQSPATVTLRSGATTRFTVTFLPWSADGNSASNDFAPTALVITPPDETSSYDLPWRWGHVLLQDAATHPGTYTGPVGG